MTLFRYRCFFGVILLTLLQPRLGYGIEPLVVDDLGGDYALAPHIEYLFDPSDELTLAAVRNEATQWLTNPGDSFNLGFIKGSVWVRIRFESDLSFPGELPPAFFLDLNTAELNNVTLSHYVDGILQFNHQSGTHHPFDTRMIKHRTFAYRIAMHTGQHELVMRISNYGGIALVPELQGVTRWFQETSRTQLLLGAALSVLVMMAVYNLIVFLIVRERVFGFFALALLAAAFYRLSSYGLGSQFLWPDNPEWHTISVRLGAGISMATLLLFTREYLHTAAWSSVLDRLLISLAVTLALVMIFPVFRAFPGLSMLLLASAPLLVLGTAMSAVAGRKPGARPFLLAWLLYCASLIVTMSRVQGWIPLNPTTEMLSQSGFFALAIITSLGLANRLVEEKVSKEFAETTALEKTRFLANMSHELRTPLNAILGFSELTLGTDLDEEQQRYLTKIRTSSDDLLNIVNDVLDFSKFETGEVVLKNAPFSLTQITEDLQATFENQTAQKGVSLDIAIDADVEDRLSGDSSVLTRILRNLVSNAFKFSQRSKVTVQISVMKRHNKEVELLVSVKDTGIGIGEPQQKILFQPFTQVDTSSTREFDGTGLGLAICRQLVEFMGGEIWFESKPDQGTTFFFTVPLLAPEPVVEISAAEAVDASVTLSGVNLLVVEDNKTNQMLAAAMLKKLGATVTMVDNGRQAVEVLENKEFDAVLMDCQMPVMDGYEATRTIRSQLGLSNLPIIAMTANAMIGDRETCLEAGMDDYIAKPVSMSEIARVVRCLVPVRNLAADRQTG